MKQFFLYFAVLVCLVSCNAETKEDTNTNDSVEQQVIEKIEYTPISVLDNPIIFSKKSEISEVRLLLDTNGTFEYVARSTKGRAFHEAGNYTIEDSLLILRFEFDSYSVGCTEIPLDNDTSMIMNYKGTPFLYPTLKEIEDANLSMTNEELMTRIVNMYQGSGFGWRVGKHYFAKESGNLSLIFKGNWKISPYYDSKIKIEE